MKSMKPSYGICITVAAVTAFVSISAHAEYRCKAPATVEDNVACDLASLGRPDELRLFIERTSSIYGLYFYDYVSQHDLERWDSVRANEDAPSITTAEDRAKEKSQR
jgi:hypothetical protein